MPNKNVVITFTHASDPSAEESQRARDLIDAVKGARLVDEIPGTLYVQVSTKAMQELVDKVQSLQSWNVSHEGQAEMPIDRFNEQKKPK